VAVQIRGGIGGGVTIGGAAAPAVRSTPLQTRLSIAWRDPNLKKAHRIFGSREHNWHNLSNVLEIVQSDIAGKIAKAGWATQAELDRFTHTANSAAAIGDDARHGHEKFQPPKNPMSLTEAKSLITGILTPWIDSK
jgi:hypothetical protein